MNLKRKLITYVKFCLVIVFLVLFTNQFIAFFCDVKGNSMNPTLLNGEKMIVSKAHYYFDEPKRFDIVVFRYNDSLLVKRIIGLPGEQLFFKNGRLYINGKWIDEAFLHEELGDNDEPFTEDFMLIEKTFFNRIPPDTYFVLGDNRPNSVDSRDIGFINKKSIEGKVIMRGSLFKYFTWVK